MVSMAMEAAGWSAAGLSAFPQRNLGSRNIVSDSGTTSNDSGNSMIDAAAGYVGELRPQSAQLSSSVLPASLRVLSPKLLLLLLLSSSGCGVNLFPGQLK